MDRVIQTVRVPLAMPRSSIIEVEIAEKKPPGDRRLKIALWLIQLAAKLVRMRVRITNAES